MKPFVKFGVIAGLVGLVVIIPISAFLGLCGPLVTLVAGAVAGYLSAYFGEVPTRRDGAQSGAIAGGIAGAITLVGQLIGNALVLNFIQLTGTPVAFGHVPGTSAPSYELADY
jgi:hypothetical protein